MPFQAVLQLLLRKGVKSLQSSLNEWTAGLDESISASALCQARRKFKHTAFIELLEKSVIDVMYTEGTFELFKGHRLLALDGSSLRLPKTEETILEFGEVCHKDSKGKSCGSQVEGKMSVLYDVLNEVPLSAELHPGRTHDLAACKEQLLLLRAKDLLIADRAYVSYEFFAQILKKQADFVVRTKKNCFKKYYKQLVDDPNCKELTVSLNRGKHIAKSTNLPEQLQVRFIKVLLPNNDIEVLITSLLDRKKFPVKTFKKLYYKRWKVETYFHTLKSRLSIDNFSGKTVEAIRQDFHSTIFVSGLETLIRGEADEQLAAKNTKHKYKVNKAVSFNIIKNKIIGLILDPPPDMTEQIRAAFMQNPVSIRPERVKERIKADNSVKARASAYFQKCARKHVF